MRPALSHRRDVTAEPGTIALLAAIFGIAGSALVLWVGGRAAALLTDHPLHRPALISGLRTLAHPGDPSRAWRQPMPAAGAYWTVTGLITLAVTAAVLVVVTVWRRAAHRQRADVHNATGLASRAEAKAAASSATLLRRATILRPSLPKPSARDIGFRLGTCRGVEAWTSVEDSLVVLGPPRSGKGLHIVIPMIRDAPGPVLTTSTRGDNIAATLAARRARGDVAVFDPQALAPSIDDAPIRWSPIRGCRDPHTAMIRARALAAGSANHVDNGDFWQAQTESALRAFLHAAALDGRDANELYRWSLNPAAAGEAVRILNATSHAAAGWADALDAIVHGDPRTRDNSWAGIRTALACLANPHVLAAVTPRAGHQLDPEAFLAGNGTLYLLGTAGGVGPAANLVAALVEDIVDVARKVAADSPAVRLDPPLALILDEAANYTLPSLPSLISEGGGTGITTVAVLQSLAQARARWGEHDGAAIWDAASVKVILGGGSNARDLADLASLIGERDDETHSATWDPRGGRSYSTNIRRIPILDAGRLRTLPFGTAVLLMRSAPPILLDLSGSTR